MNIVTIEKNTIIKRLEGIASEVLELKKLGTQPFEEFSAQTGWKLAQFHLHRALEGVFNISTHILSRIPGGQATQYKEIALKMGEHDIVTADFARTKLVNMAKYRNRLVHFYAEVNAQELYNIIHHHLVDFEIFMTAIKAVLLDPKKYHLEVS